MIDLVLFVGRVLLVVVLYIFLFAVMRTGVGLVRGQRRDAAIWSVDVEKGTRSLRGLHVDILGPVGLAARNAETVADAFVIFDKFMAAYSPAISARITVPVGTDLRRFEFEYLLDPAPPQAHPACRNLRAATPESSSY